MKLATVLRWTFIGLGGLVGCAIIGIAAYLWRNSRPSEAARELLALHAARGTVREADNAFVYLWGIGGPADVEPFDLGRRRVAWLREHFEDPATSASDPAADQKYAHQLRSPALRELVAACGSGAASPCTLAFDRHVASARMTPLEQRQLSRYRELVKYPRWYESVPFETDVPLAPFDHASEGQWLQLVELARLAERGESAQVAEGLDRDLVFWRELQRDADILITKMFASSALRRHFFFGNRILRRLPPEAVVDAIPSGWHRAFDAEELSMLRVFAGEFAFATSNTRRRELGDGLTGGDPDFDDEYEQPDFSDRLVQHVGRTLNPPQRSLNRIAAAYLNAAREFRAPLQEYRAITERLEAKDPVFKAQGIGGYVARNATVEGERRAALLAAEMRSLDVPRDQVAAEVAASALVDPFTRRPFTWNAQDSTLTFEAPRVNGKNRIQIYLY